MSEWSQNNWKSRTLSDLADYYNGRAFKPSEWQKSGLPIIRIAQLNNPANITDYCDPNDLDNNNIVKTGDLLFSWSATLKVITWKGPRAALNQHIFKVQERSDVDKTYLRYLLETSIDKLAESSHGSTMKHIKKGVLDDFEILLPPLAEQKKIAEILSSVDEVIENTESEISKLEDLKKATLNELLTKGIGHTEFKDSEIGRIPKSWATSTAEGLYEKVRVQVVYDKNTVGLRGKYEVIDQSASGSIGFIEEPTFHCSVDSPLVTFANHTCAVRLIQKPFGVIQNVFPLRSKAGVDPLFLYYSLLGAIPQTAYKGHYPELREKVFAVPSSLEQNKISTTICAIDQQISAISQRREKVLGLRKAIQEVLLSGKVRVKVN